MASIDFPTITPGFVSLPIEGDIDWETIVTPTEMGQRGRRDEYTRALRTFIIGNKILSQRNEEIILGFYNWVRGSTRFNWTNTEKVVSPQEPPTLTGSTAGGTLAERTLYVTYTWGDGTLQTIYSQEASITVLANKLLTVDVPFFLPSVTQANVFVGTVSGTLHRVSEITTDGGTWTEAETSVDTTSAAGQTTLQVADESGFTAGDSIVIGLGTAREETKIVDSTAAGEIETTVNLAYEHTDAQADKVNHDYTAGAAAPTTNDFTETVEVVFDAKPKWRRLSATNYQFVCVFLEAF